MSPRSLELRTLIHRNLEECLEQCVDQKRLAGGTQRAIALAQEAYQLATTSPEIRSPWPEIAAYRLAMLELRSADRTSLLNHIDQLLVEAAGGPEIASISLIGPLPAIYRLAVLSLRRNAETNELRRREIHGQLELAVQRAAACIRRQWLADNSSETPLQQAFFNLFELSTLFLNMDYSTLEGLGSPFLLDPMASKHWALVGPDPSMSAIRYTHEMAEPDLLNLERLNPGAVVFSLGEHDEFWRVAGSAEWIGATREQIKLLSNLLYHPSIDLDELRDRVVGEDGRDPGGRFRKIKERTKESLRQLLEIPDLPVFDGQKLICPVPIFGKVLVSALYELT